MRINKFFTEQGLCSRREADRLIAEGRVTINGQVAKLGDQVSPQDLVARDGVVLQRGNRLVYLKYHKPVGVTTTTELHVRRNIIAEIGHTKILTDSFCSRTTATSSMRSCGSSTDMSGNIAWKWIGNSTKRFSCGWPRG